MKKTLYQRFLALMLASVMVLGMCPVPSFAAAGEGGGSSSVTVSANATSSSANVMNFTSSQANNFLRVTVVRVPINSPHGDLYDTTKHGADESGLADVYSKMTLSAVQSSGYQSWTLDYPLQGFA